MTTKPSGFIQRSLKWWDTLTGALDALQPLAAWLARLYLAQAVFMSGLTKLRDWETTVALFTDEYHVPLLSPQVAAALRAAGELALPVAGPRPWWPPVCAGAGCGERCRRDLAQRNCPGGLSAARVLGFAAGRAGHFRFGAVVI